jgi:pimeloyl-ACP methyl ester carboxylesterase
MIRLRTPLERRLYYRAQREGDAPMATVLADDGVRISYCVQGAGPTTLLFMHGWAGSGAYFDEVIGGLDSTRFGSSRWTSEAMATLKRR